ncbi:MAG: FkbM family methyltransferase [Bacteroidetes bacterium]|nr:MAG: FkbM family methyltransferase [Bacteroidota bacterium]TAF93586.1 MAG: FkbM family methyltransferase [Bacteroidota bacterium]
MKVFLQRNLQRILGYQAYLTVFSIYSVFRAFAGKYEVEFSEFLKLLSHRPDGCILDVGANIGITAVPLAKKFPKETIHAFEPIPANMQTLQKVSNIFRCSNIKFHPIALSNSSGVATMIVPETDGVKRQGLSRMQGIDDEALYTEGEEITVQLTTLDDWWQNSKNPAVKGIKMDVENFEYQVLLGAKQLLLNNKPIIYCELWNDDKRISCIQYMHGLGYSACVFVNGAIVPYTNQTVMNFYFIPVSK